MKKPKVSLDGAKIKSLFVQHVEKLLLVVVLVLVVWFVYKGYSLPGLEGEKTPDGLLKAANSTQTHIDNPNRWNEIAGKRAVNANYVSEVGDAQKPTNPAGYHLPNPINRPNHPKLSPRTDPKIFPPINLVVVPVIGPLAGLPEGTENDPLTQAIVEAQPPEEKKKPKPKPKKTAQPPGSEMYGPEASGYSQQRPTRGKSRTKSRNGYGEADLLSGSEMEMPMATEGASGYGASYGMGGPTGINPESILGFTGQEQSTIQRPARAMEIMAVVPYEKQIEEFENALASSLDYDPQRDFPYYLQFWVERAESVDPEPDPASLTWTQLGVNSALTQAMTKWAGAPTEIIDPTYWDQKLTHPAPPFMQRDLWDLLTHPDVPLAVLNPTAMPIDGSAPGAPGATDAPSDVPTLPGGAGTAGYGAGSAGYGSEMGGSGSGLPSFLGGGQSYQAPTFGGGMQGGSGYGMQGGSGYGMQGGGGYGMQGGAGYGMQAPGTEGSSGYGSGYGMSGAALAPPKYKLIRFTDFTVKPGTYYQYRIRVLLHDPNHPATGLVPPSLPSLHEDVRKRIKEVEAADAKKGANARTYWVVSDPSEPSKPTRLPDPRQYFVGEVTQPTTSIIVEGKPRVPQSQPQAKALTVVWDDATVVDVPAEKDVYRGSWLNFQAEEVKVIHPVMRTPFDIPKFTFTTDALVADMEGGDIVPPVDKKNDKPLKTPGELLVFDAEGNLHVQNETDDIEAYRQYTVPKPEMMDSTTDPNSPYGAPGAEGDLLGGDAGAGGYGRPTRQPGRSRGSQP